MIGWPVGAEQGLEAWGHSLPIPAQLTTLGPGHRLPELGTIDLFLLTNPRTEQRPAVRALIATVLASGSRTLAAYRDQYTAAPATQVAATSGNSRAGGDEQVANPISWPRYAGAYARAVGPRGYRAARRAPSRVRR